MKIAVIGDSRATAWGSPKGTRAFPELLPATMTPPCEVRNFARQALTLDRYLADLDELRRYEPDVVLSVFGGRESLLRLPRYLRRLRCDYQEDLRGRGVLRPVLRVRALLWRFLVFLLRDLPRIGERVWKLFGAESDRTTRQYRAALITLLDEIAPQVGQIVLVDYFSTVMNRFPYKASARLANSATIRELADGYDNVHVFDPKDHMSFERVFLSDGSHFDAHGHEVVAQVLAEHLETCRRQLYREADATPAIPAAASAVEAEMSPLTSA